VGEGEATYVTATPSSNKHICAVANRQVKGAFGRAGDSANSWPTGALTLHVAEPQDNGKEVSLLMRNYSVIYLLGNRPLVLAIRKLT
jgi:hypothetical protein